MKLNKRLTCLILASGMLILAACTPQPGSPPTTSNGQTPAAGTPGSPSAENRLAGTKWTLVSFGTPGAESPLVEGSTITIEFKEDGQVGGSGGCNSYGGEYQVKGNMLLLNNISSTLMACADERVTQQEQQFFAALGSAGEFELSGDQLRIFYDNGQGVLHFKPAS
jgi:heat shock protein HslJ